MHFGGVFCDEMLRVTSSGSFSSAFTPYANDISCIQNALVPFHIEAIGVVSTGGPSFGNVGQCSSAAASAYLDLLASSRRHSGTLFSSMQFPTKQVAIEPCAVPGASPFDEIAAYMAFVLAPTRTYAPILTAIAAPDTPKLYVRSDAATNTSLAPVQPTTRDEITKVLAPLTPTQRRNHLETTVLRVIGELTGKSSSMVSIETPLMEAGIDSLAATEL
eukprot:3971594-Prymnesium_polylepis.1